MIHQGHPGYLKYFNCEVFNNTYRVHYKYMSSNITKTELSQIQAYPLEDPVLEGDAPDLEKAVLRHDAHRFQRTLQEYNQTSTWPSCQANLKSQHCKSPNESHTPEIVFVYNPKDCEESLEIPVFTVEIIGSKNIWSSDTTT